MFNSPRLLNLPLLLVANKQDKEGSLSVAEVRESFDAWQRARPQRADGTESPADSAERMASLDVMGVSALEGWVCFCGSVIDTCLLSSVASWAFCLCLETTCCASASWRWAYHEPHA